MRILVVDDEKDLAESIAKGLKREGYGVDTAYSGEEALESAAINSYDLICLDVTMPGISGREVCGQMRGDSGTYGDPKIIMITAMGDLPDRIGGLDEGADDYLVKGGFQLPELYARVRALLRRDSAEVSSSVLSFGNLTLDLNSHIAVCHGQELELTAKEFSLARFFMSSPNKIFSQEELLEHIWDSEADPFTQTVRVTVSNLRRKLKAADADANIQTVIRRGYKLTEGGGK